MIGSQLAERYELREELGRGGRGVVYRAWDPLLQRQVAVKLIPPTLFDAENEQRFQREAQVVAQLDHPSIVSVFDFGRHQGTLFFVMPLIVGDTLRQRIEAGDWRLGEVLEVGAQVADALEHSHQAGVVHRDIKPENIMIHHDDSALRVRVMDFGMAWDGSDTRLTQTGNLPGTLAYLSPEQVSSIEPDGRADLYSLATVLFECLAGEPPFSGPLYTVLYRIVHETPKTLASHGLEVAPELDDLIRRCLAKNPNERPASGREMASELERLAGGLSEHQRHRPLVTQAPRLPAVPATPLVGRRSEISNLGDRLSAALAGECQLGLLAGGAGVGKTRLLHELETMAIGRGIRVLHGRFSGRDQAFPYQGLCELVQDYFRSWRSGSSSLSATAASPTRGFTDLAPDLLELFPQLSEIAELRAARRMAEESERVSVVEPEVSHAGGVTRLYELLARTFIRLADGQPLVLILENLHFGDLAVAALQYIVRRLGATATFVVGSYRPEEIDRSHPLIELRRSFGDDPRLLHLEIKPLESPDVEQLLEQLLGSSSLRPELVAKIHDATEGNPLFLHELVQSLLESGEILRDESGTWHLASEVGSLARALPSTLQQAVESRLDRLPRELASTLSVAAVLGRSFDFKDLESLLPGDELDDHVDALQLSGLLEEEAGSRGDQLTFSSSVVCEVLYRQLSRRRRRSLHRRFARRLEERFADRLERVFPQLVHHFSCGDVAAETVKYALALARRSLETFSPEDAIQAARTGLELVDDEEVEQPLRVEGELLMLLAAAHRDLGNLGRATHRAEQAVRSFDRAEYAEGSAEAILLLAEAAWQGRRVELVRRWVDRGIELTRQLEAKEALVRFLTLGATLCNLRGEGVTARLYLQEVETLLPSTVDDSGTMESVPIGGTLRIGLPQRIDRIVPGNLETDAASEAASNVFETLLIAADGRLLPNLCRDWQGSADGRTFVLSLRPDVCFSDATPLSAELLKTSFELSAQTGKGSMAPGFYRVIVGMEEFLAGNAQHASGLRVTDALSLEIQLVESLPIFPALLTDARTAVVRQADGHYLGTGPFTVEGLENGVAALARDINYWRGNPAPVERIEFHSGTSATERADGLRRGELDVGCDLLPEDLAELLRDPAWRRGLVEILRKNTYFVLFNLEGPATHRPEVRQALASVVWPQELVWRTVGRFAQPAVGLIPPGIFGHDPGRRWQRSSLDEASRLLDEAGIERPLQIRASVHAALLDRYVSLTSALITEWAELGVEIEIVTANMDEFLTTYHEADDIDLMIARWNPDYEDPDNFGYNILHSEGGLFRRYFADAEADSLLARARQERDNTTRQALYHRFEDLLRERNALVPLFHDIDYRLASPQVHGMRLRGTYPYINYGQLGVSRKPRPAKGEAADRLSSTGRIEAAISIGLKTLDPVQGDLTERLEILGNVFETLTRLERGARIVPWLAARFELEHSCHYRFYLRRGLRFQDGRRVSARDVRYSFERLIKSSQADLHPMIMSICGARDLRAGKVAEMPGFHIVSRTEFVIELERPVSFFPAVLTHPALGIVPEDSDRFDSGFRDGCVGTGPFRVIHFDPEVGIELERNPHYWRPGYPKVARLDFRFAVDPATALQSFQQGELTLAASLPPDSVSGLRRDRQLRPGYRESPRLSTQFLVLNVSRPPFSSHQARAALAALVDPEMLTRESLGRLVTPAHGLFPPGLLGHEERGRVATSNIELKMPEQTLRVVLHPAFMGTYASFWQKLMARLNEAGIHIESTEELMENRQAPDLTVVRWVADYPDTDAFMIGLTFCQKSGYTDLSGYPEIASLTEESRLESDPALRHALYRQLDDLLLREHLVIPLFHEQAYRFCQNTLRGLRLSFGFPEVRYEELYFDS